MDTAAERGLADMPRPLYGQAVALHDDKLYVVGGTSGYTYFMDVHVLDLTHRRWQVGRRVHARSGTLTVGDQELTFSLYLITKR